PHRSTRTRRRWPPRRPGSTRPRRCNRLLENKSSGCRPGRSSGVLGSERPLPVAGRPEETDMRVMVMVKATRDSEAGIMPTTELLEAMGKYNQELVNAGIMLSGDGLKPSSQGKRIAFDGTSRTVMDGPFTETSELVAGFWIWQVKDMAEAVAWAKRCPNPMPGPSELEIRPFYEMEDFGEALTPDVAALHERTRAGQAGT